MQSQAFLSPPCGERATSAASLPALLTTTRSFDTTTAVSMTHSTTSRPAPSIRASAASAARSRIDPRGWGAKANRPHWPKRLSVSRQILGDPVL